MRVTGVDHPSAPSPGPAWTRADWLALVGITIGALGLRLAGLNRPINLVFDEIFYANNGCQYVLGSSACGAEGLASRAHPPLGNWLVGAGIKLFGFTPFGWRITAALAGTLSVLLVYLLARRLLSHWNGSTSAGAAIGAAAAAGLLATDFLHLVQSRIAMLDVFLTVFVVAAVLFIVLDAERDRGRPAAGWSRLALGRPWRLAAGASLGAAAAVKWSGGYVALAVIGLTIAWEIAARRRDRDARWPASVLGALREEALPTLMLLVVVPVLIYLASYTGRMPGELFGLPWRAGTVWRGIWDHQAAMLDFHTTLAGNHPYESAPWAWLLDRRPVAFYFSQDGGRYREILAVGNPLTWWPGLLALVAMAISWARSGFGLWRAEPVVLGAAITTYLPWLVLSGSRSETFIWYILPTVPFLCIALGWVVAWAWQRVAGRVLVAAWGALLVFSFAFYFPLLTGLPVTPDGWRAHMLFTDCRRPGAPTLDLPDSQVTSGPPPEGWCWI